MPFVCGFGFAGTFYECDRRSRVSISGLPNLADDEAAGGISYRQPSDLGETHAAIPAISWASRSTATRAAPVQPSPSARRELVAPRSSATITAEHTQPSPLPAPQARRTQPAAVAGRQHGHDVRARGSTPAEGSTRRRPAARSRGWKRAAGQATGLTEIVLRGIRRLDQHEADACRRSTERVSHCPTISSWVLGLPVRVDLCPGRSAGGRVGIGVSGGSFSHGKLSP